MRSRARSRLSAALIVSVLLHGIGLLRIGASIPPPAAREALAVRLEPAGEKTPPRAAAPPAVLKDTLTPKPGHGPGRRQKAAKPDPRDARRRPALRAERLPADAAQQASRRLSQNLFYPPEALRQGLEGEVVLLLETGAGGRIEMASVASSSGHGVLDEAALRAVHRMGGLGPAAAGKTILFTVRFRIQ